MIRVVLLSLWLLTPVVLRAVEPSRAPVMDTNTCPAFTLRDQFDTNHEFKFPSTKPIVLAVADKKGSDEIEAWAHPLAVRFGDRITIPGLADVSAVPRPLRGYVQSRFKKAITHPVMLDWDGDIASRFKYTKGQANVYLIAPDGRILHRVSGKATEAKLKLLSDEIETVLKTLPQANARSN